MIGLELPGVEVSRIVLGCLAQSERRAGRDETEFMRRRVIELEHGGKAEESEAGCGNRRRPASPLGHPPSEPTGPK
jgi:hypothetical protein